MNRILISTSILAAAALTADHIVELRQRLDELEQRPRTDPAIVTALEREIGSLRTALGEARRSFEDDESIERVEGKLAIVASALERERCRVEEQEAILTRWREHAPEVLDVRLRELDDELAAREAELLELRRQSTRIADEGQRRFDELENLVEPLCASQDTQLLWHELVGPVVQLSGDTTVGSGVLLESRPRATGEGWVTHLITSWHVVRDIYGSIERVSMPVPVRMYTPDGSFRDQHAHMVAYDVSVDIALLEMDLDTPVPHGARLAPRSKIAEVSVFDPVIAVGCPLGNDPIPTSGSIAATHHVVDGQSYWMVSAPTYIGNSGGGIFDEHSHELVGIFSKIYTHGASRSTIVPHMGLATPLPVVYEWLDRAGVAALVEPIEVEPQTASAQR